MVLQGRALASPGRGITAYLAITSLYITSCICQGIHVSEYLTLGCSQKTGLGLLDGAELCNNGAVLVGAVIVFEGVYNLSRRGVGFDALRNKLCSIMFLIDHLMDLCIGLIFLHLKHNPQPG